MRLNLKFWLFYCIYMQKSVKFMGIYFVLLRNLIKFATEFSNNRFNLESYEHISKRVCR